MSGNLHKINNLSNEQRRQLIDVGQTFEVYQEVSKLLARSYDGSMRWLTRNGRDYLHRKRGGYETSLGVRSEKTEAQYEAFLHGRMQKRNEAAQLTERLNTMAPVNRALGLGRVPRITSKLLRQLDKAGLLGNHLWVLGTNALFAYEAKSGVHLPGELLATTDADLLWDVRKHITLLTPEVRKEGVLGQLQKVDRSFQLRSKQDFRAFNADGFLVDLIRPEFDAYQPQSQPRRTVGEAVDDFHGASIFGLTWLVNVPRFESIAIGEDGYPLRIATIDPRAFSLHKLWLSERAERNPLKAPRDLAQAEMIAHIAQTHLALHFDEEVLRALPARLRARITQLRQQEKANTDDIPEPDW